MIKSAMNHLKEWGIKNFFKAGSPALKYKWCYFVLAVIGIASIGLDLAYAEVNRALFSNIDSITAQMAVRIVSAFGLIIAAQYIIGFLDNCVGTYFNESVVYAMRRELLKRIEHLPLEYFDNNHSGKIINLFFSQLETVKDFVVSDLQALIRLPLSFIIISGYLFTVHPLLGFIAVFSSVLQPLSSFVFRKKYESACDDVRITTNNSLDNQGAPDKNRLSCGNRCVCVPYYQRRYRSRRPYSIYNAAFKGVWTV